MFRWLTTILLKTRIFLIIYLKKNIMKLVDIKDDDMILYRYNTITESFLTVTNPIYLFNESERKAYEEFTKLAKDKKHRIGKDCQSIYFKYLDFNISIGNRGKGFYDVVYTIGDEYDYVVQGIFIN